MNVDLSLLIIYLGFPAILGMGTFIFRSIFKRLENLENKMSQTTNEPQVRQLIKDKYDPLSQDIREIKEMQQKLLDLIIKNPK